jgi:anti-sigma-K factor RskA
MTENRHESFIENIPAYVLGALSRAEASDLEKHLETCKKCKTELALYRQIGDGLSASILPLETAPAIVKRKLLESLDAEAPARSKTRWGFRPFAMGALAFILLGFNLLAFQQIRDLRQQQSQLAGQIEKNHTILGMLSASTEVHPISGNGFSGNLLLDREKNLSYLLVWNLPLPPQDQVYQIWLVGPDGSRVDAGSFRPDTEHPFTSTALLTSRNFTEFTGMEVTVEPSGGSGAPTGERIMSVDY